jgi:hypothetical protein
MATTDTYDRFYLDRAHDVAHRSHLAAWHPDLAGT